MSFDITVKSESVPQVPKSYTLDGIKSRPGIYAAIGRKASSRIIVPPNRGRALPPIYVNTEDGHVECLIDGVWSGATFVPVSEVITVVFDNRE